MRSWGVICEVARRFMHAIACSRSSYINAMYRAPGLYICIFNIARTFCNESGNMCLLELFVVRERKAEKKKIKKKKEKDKETFNNRAWTLVDRSSRDDVRLSPYTLL